MPPRKLAREKQSIRTPAPHGFISFDERHCEANGGAGQGNEPRKDAFPTELTDWVGFDGIFRLVTTKIRRRVVRFARGDAFIWLKPEKVWRGLVGKRRTACAPPSGSAHCVSRKRDPLN